MSTQLREPDRHRVSSAELVRNISYWQERAIEHPVVVTYHGRDRLVLGPFSLLAGGGPDARTRDGSADDKMALLRAYMHEAYVFWDHDGRCLDLNTATEIYFGVPREQLLGRTFEEVFGYPMPSAPKMYVDDALTGSQPVSVEFDSVMFPGRRIMARFYAHPHGAAVLFSNITAQTQLAKRTRRMESTVAALDAHPDIAKVCLDAFGRITTCTQPLLNWSQLDAEVVHNRMLIDLLDKASRRDFTDASITAMEQHTPQCVDVRFLAKDLSAIPLRLSIAGKLEGNTMVGACLTAIRI